MGWKKFVKRRDDDLDFLAWVRSCRYVEELRVRRAEFPSDQAIERLRQSGQMFEDQWKVVAIDRAIRRLDPHVGKCVPSEGRDAE